MPLSESRRAPVQIFRIFFAQLRSVPDAEVSEMPRDRWSNAWETLQIAGTGADHFDPADPSATFFHRAFHASGWCLKYLSKKSSIIVRWSTQSFQVPAMP